MLEPEIAAFIARTAAIYPGAFDFIAAERAARDLRSLCGCTYATLPAGVIDEDAVFQASAGHPIRLRLYRNRGKASGTPCGTVLFFHGGGFVLGSLDSHEIVTARLAADTGLDVIAVDYRLAPEHRAPSRA